MNRAACLRFVAEHSLAAERPLVASVYGLPRREVYNLVVSPG